MNSYVKSFYQINQINPELISRHPMGRTRSPMEINDIIYKYGVRKGEEEEMVSIADIEGYDYVNMGINPYIAYSMDSFFDGSGDGYHSRSIGLLDYTKQDAVDRIDFKREKIVVQEMGDNKYIVSRNGLHRYTLLRILYLSEYMNSSKTDREKVKEKYTIPVIVTKIDELRTYAKYLLMAFPCGVKDVQKDVDTHRWEYTGKIVIRRNDGNDIILDTDEDFLNYVKTYANAINQNIDVLQYGYNKYESFRRFLEMYFYDVLNLKTLREKREEMMNLEGDTR